MRKKKKKKLVAWFSKIACSERIILKKISVFFFCFKVIFLLFVFVVLYVLIYFLIKAKIYYVILIYVHISPFTIAPLTKRINFLSKI